MMEVFIKLAGPLNKFYRTSRSAKREEAYVPEGATVADLLAHYDVPGEAVNLVVVNRQRVDSSAVLREGDEVWVIPLAAGG